MSEINPQQCTDARTLLEMSEEALAQAANVGLGTIRSFESGLSTPTANSLRSIRIALQDAGVEFTPENGDGAGVRLAKRKRAK